MASERFSGIVLTRSRGEFPMMYANLKDLNIMLMFLICCDRLTFWLRIRQEGCMVHLAPILKVWSIARQRYFRCQTRIDYCISMQIHGRFWNICVYILYLYSVKYVLIMYLWCVVPNLEIAEWELQLVQNGAHFFLFLIHDMNISFRPALVSPLWSRESEFETKVCLLWGLYSLEESHFKPRPLRLVANMGWGDRTIG